MSADTLATVISAFGIVVTLGAGMLAGFAWCIRRTDALDTKLSARIGGVDGDVRSLERSLTTRIDSVEEKLTARIDSVEEKLTARIDSVEEKLTTRIDAVASDTTELKIAIARLERPERHLITPR